AALDKRVTGVAKAPYWRDIFARYGRRRLRESFFLVAEPAAREADPALFGFIVGEVRAREFGSAPYGWIFALSVEQGARLRDGGGSQFSGNARRVTLLDVIELFEHFGAEDASDKAGESTDEGRVLRHVLDEIDDISRATFGSITIATMLKLMERQRTDHRRG